MIERVDGLGLSLKPPKWARQAVSSLIQGKPTSVPVPGGGTVTVTPPTATVTPPTTAEKINAGIEGNVPGGWLTIGAGVLALLFLPKLMRRGRR